MSDDSISNDRCYRIAKAFRCPKCGGHRLEEVMLDVTVFSDVVSCGTGGDCEYGKQSNDGGAVDRYQCSECGWTVPDIHDAEQLFEWLDNANRNASDADG